MNPKESRRVYILEQTLKGCLTVGQAAQLLNLSKRQVIRLKGRMKAAGVAGLAHGNRGRKPKHALPKEVREQVIRLAAGPLRGASCQHMAELLLEHYGIRLSAKSIGRVMAGAHLPLCHTHKAARRRKSRERAPQKGLLVQCDASPFLWLEDRGPDLSLHGFIDDATGKILGLYLRRNEDTTGYFHALLQMLQNHGVPQSLYTDRHSIFFSNQKKLSVEEELAGQTASLTQFGQALRDLGINHIPARSPQAKGRVERLWGTLQSRLMLEFRLAGISSRKQANAFLPGFIQRFNQRFAVEPMNINPAFRPCPSPSMLNQILAFRQLRKVSHGSSFSYRGHTYQLVDSKGDIIPLQSGRGVTVLTHLNSSLSALYGGKRYLLRELAKQPKAETMQKEPKIPASTAHIPPPNHPWRHLPINPANKAKALLLDKPQSVI